MSPKYKITDIPPEGAAIPVQISRETAQARMNKAGTAPVCLAAPVEGLVRLERSGSRILARGRIKTVCRAECARCLESFDLPVEEEMIVVYTPHTGEETREELQAEELTREFFSGEEIDLWLAIQEHIFLGVPIKALCREDCPGLCPRCGAPQTDGPCVCERSGGHPGLAGLKDIRDKLPK